MTKILGLSGRKVSGKNTIANTIMGLWIKSLKITKAFKITDKGNLWVNDIDGDKKGRGVLDLSSRTLNENMDNFCKHNLDEHVKLYSFADVLKQKICIDVLGLTHKQCYGSNSDKSSDTHLRWENMPGIITHEPGPMTAREVLQYVGTEIFRKMHGDVWVNALMRQIEQDGPEMAIITDARFPNEVEGIQKAGGQVMRLTRAPFPDDMHDSECSLDKDKFDWNKFDHVIDNSKLGVDRQFEPIYRALFPIGWLPLEVFDIVQVKRE